MMPVQALVLVPLAIRVDDFSGAARTRASYWAVGNSLLTNSWASHPPTRLMLKGATWPSLGDRRARDGARARPAAARHSNSCRGLES